MSKQYRLLGAVLILMLLATPLIGHHIRGIPHYSYRDNYPETPVYEVIEITANYEVTFTYYKIPGQNALDLAIYIKDTLSGKPFTEPVTFRVFGRREDPALSHPFVAYRNPTNVYKVGWVYEEEGDYHVRITFADSVRTNNLLMDLSVGDTRQVELYLGGAVALVVSFIIVTAIIKRRKAVMAAK